MPFSDKGERDVLIRCGSFKALPSLRLWKEVGDILDHTDMPFFSRKS